MYCSMSVDAQKIVKQQKFKLIIVDGRFFPRVATDDVSFLAVVLRVASVTSSE